MNSHKKKNHQSSNSLQPELETYSVTNGKKDRPNKDRGSLKIRLTGLDTAGGFVNDELNGMEEDIFSDKSFRKIKKFKKNSGSSQRFEPIVEKPPKIDEEIFVEEYS